MRNDAGLIGDGAGLGAALLALDAGALLETPDIGAALIAWEAGALTDAAQAVLLRAMLHLLLRVTPAVALALMFRRAHGATMPVTAEYAADAPIAPEWIVDGPIRQQAAFDLELE